MTIAVLETINFGLGYLVDAARERGHEVILLTGERSRYTHELSKAPGDSIRVVDVDTGNVDEVISILRAVPDLAGLVRMADPWSLQALAVADRLGLPHENTEAVSLLRDKGRLRRHLYDNGFSRSPSVVFDPLTANPAELIRLLPFPCVVKDVAGSLSQNVWLVRKPEELASVLVAARHAEDLRGGALTAEPYFLGPMYSAETVSWAGETKIIGVTSRALSPEPHFREEMGSFPVNLPETMRSELAKWLSAILCSVGYHEGVTHTEFIITTGGFEIVEINTRMGGALIGESINRSLGINFHSAFIDLALGRRPLVMDLDPEIRQGTTQIAVYAPGVGTFDGISGAEQLRDHPGTPTLYPIQSPGDAIPATTDQRGVLAMLLADGETAELSLHNALSAAGKLTVRMR
ncbi:biotin carboxylase [Micromonospora pisi]|uniref:Biotin carboxylase n=1 Tax=Micromonospora pisi TaxID=589240 RepID=A0A495JTW9_9ACTN|nr:ATP-grasp domain-containing protein [Micromonospora pisi]RKR91814.1 biotin carboxylase [Micromonospora pisi]